MKIRHLILALCFWVWAWTDPVQASGARDLADGWLLGPAATVEFLAGQPLSPDGFWVTAGQSRLFNLPSLPVLAVEAGLRLGQWPGKPVLAVAWQTLGEGIFVEDQRRVHLQWGQVPVVGLAWRSVGTRTGGISGAEERQDDRWSVDAVLQGSWRPVAASKVEARLWLPLTSGGLNSLADARRPFLQLQGWAGATALAVTVDRKADQTPTVALEWGLGWGGGSCGLRVDLATGVAGPVINWRRGLLLVRTSHLAHPQLGVTHRLQVGFGAWGAAPW